jgi:hypothetical protein
VITRGEVRVTFWSNFGDARTLTGTNDSGLMDLFRLQVEIEMGILCKLRFEI